MQLSQRMTFIPSALFTFTLSLCSGPDDMRPPSRSVGGYADYSGVRSVGQLPVIDNMQPEVDSDADSQD